MPCQINLRILTLFIRKILENARFMLKIKFNYFLP
nr:MAG TPA: hypothetical protein [Caudoviricetes sp.]